MRYYLVVILAIMWGCITVLAGWPWWVSMLGGGAIAVLALGKWV